MKRQHLVLYGAAAAVLVIGAAAFGVAPGTLFALAFLVLCPAMMIFMMGGMRGGSMGHGGDDDGVHRHDNVGPSGDRSGGDAR
ncbi:hypothetical protein DQ237_00730 [Blastococcus sp. TF02-8]|uniref:DUF2933 domain-containing protein n=1 Tax=Blastococcus sp. TF02-8 TaxID=2250574 RepID=UPI000DE8D707|nr:DUF2933 domain-containing protein [Blastococcus sp. TF02-8]RBY98099.1 hypothetical protein DQ237_00730 [Blastococcus sp. TF02-8]